MGFGKRGKSRSRWSATWQEADFMSFTGAQVDLLAQYLGVRRDMAKCRIREERRKMFRDFCGAQPEKAQKGYEMIVLNASKDSPVLTGTDGVSKDEVLQVVRDAITGSAIDSIEGALETLAPQILQYAHKAMDAAAEKRAPLTIKNLGKTKQIKGTLPAEFKRILELASARIPILLVGPAGCGKTYLCEKVAEALDLEYSDQSCSEGMSESVFNGRLLPIGKAGNFEHVHSPFMERYETGGVMLLDEMDAGDPNLFTYINKAIANSCYTVEQRWKKPRVQKHKDFVLIAAANTFGHGADSMYVGRNQLDGATLDRFKVGLVAMDFSRTVEETLAPKDLCEWAWLIRERIATHKLRRIMSTRVIKNLGTMTEMYAWKREQWEQAYFSGWSVEDKRMVS